MAEPLSPLPHTYEDQAIARRYWDQEVAPTLGDLPNGGVLYLRSQYVYEVGKSPAAIEGLRQWASAKAGQGTNEGGQR